MLTLHFNKFFFSIMRFKTTSQAQGIPPILKISSDFFLLLLYILTSPLTALGYCIKNILLIRAGHSKHHARTGRPDIVSPQAATTSCAIMFLFLCEWSEEWHDASGMRAARTRPRKLREARVAELAVRDICGQRRPCCHYPLTHTHTSAQTLLPAV